MPMPPNNSPIGEKSFKSDARPSDTKSVVLHKERDADLLAYLRTIKHESELWRKALRFYLDFFDWLALQPGPDKPEPHQSFIHYKAWLESRQPANLPTFQPVLDPDAIASAILPGMRDVVDAALATALAGVSLASASGPAAEAAELADLFSAELVLE